MKTNYELLELLHDRYSVRKFTEEAVSDEVLNKILEAGRIAPTACNNQPHKILVIRTEEGMEKLKKCTSCTFGAKAALLVCYDKDLCWYRKYDGKSSGDIDASIVTTHLMLEAASLGVGTTWVMWFDPKAMRREFNIPENFEPTALLPLGYPAEDCVPAPLHTQFRPVEETVIYESF